MDATPTHDELTQRLKELEAELGTLRRQYAAAQAQVGRLNSILASTQDFLVLKDKDFVYQAVNRAFCEFLGKSEAEIIGRTDFELFPPAEAEMYRRDDARILETGVAQVQDEVVTGGEGFRVLQVAKTPVVDETRDVVGLLCSVRDITARKQAEEAARLEKERLIAILESISDGFFSLDEDLRLTYFNRAAEQLLKRKREEVLGQRLFEAFPEVRGSIFEEKFTQALQEKIYLAFETNFGVEPYAGWYQVSAYPFKDGISVYFQIITERKRTEAAIRASEEKYRLLFELASDVIVLHDLDGRYFEVNPAFCRLTGFSREELLNMHVHELDTGKDDESAAARIHQIAEGRTLVFEATHRRKDNTLIEFEASSRLLDYQGRPAIMTMARDITGRKRAEQALRQRELELREAQRIAQVGSWKWDPNTDTVTWSEELYRIAGRDPGLPAPSYAEHSGLFTPKSMQRLTAAVQEALQSGTPYELELEILCPDGTSRILMAHGEAEQGAQGQVTGLRGTVHDMTVFKQMERELLEHRNNLQALVASRTSELAQSEERVRLLLNSTAEGIYGLDRQGICTFCNRACLRLLSYGREDELLGRDMHAIMHHTRPDGSHYPTESCMIIQGALSGQEVHNDQEIFWRRDGSAFPVEYWSYPVIRAGEHIGVVVTFNDISQRKKAETKLREFAETQRVLVQEINHRVKNNLAAILGILQQEKMKRQALAPAADMALIDDMARRIHGLATVHTLLAASEWRPLMLADLCERVIDSVIGGMARRGEIVFQVTPCSVMVNSTRAHHLTLVINELATNSVKYGATGQGALAINIEISQKDSEVLICFRDNGPGYPSAIISGDYSGAGTGFELIRGIVAQSLRGRVTFKNDNGAVAVINFRND